MHSSSQPYIPDESAVAAVQDFRCNYPARAPELLQVETLGKHLHLFAKDLLIVRPLTLATRNAG